MITYLIKATNEVRVESMEEVEKLHKQLQQDADNNECVLKTFSWLEKETKKTGEVYYVVKYTFVFNDEKSPDRVLSGIEYYMTDTGTVDLATGELM